VFVGWFVAGPCWAGWSWPDWSGRGRCRLSGGGDRVDVGDSDQVVNSAGDEEPVPVSLSAFVAKFASTGHGFDPPEWFLDPFTFALTDLMPNVSGGALINRAGPVSGVLRDVGG
jgi:hypothetical protein